MGERVAVFAQEAGATTAIEAEQQQQQLLEAANWADLPLPALKSIGRSLDIISCLSARLVCSSWCDGASSSIASLLLTPALLATYGPEPIKRCLNRLAHLENIDLALASTEALSKQRAYSAEHVLQLLELVAQHCKQRKLPALLAFVEQLHNRRTAGNTTFGAALAAAMNIAAGGVADGAAGEGSDPQSQQQQQLASWQRQGFGQGLQELGPKLMSMRLSDASLLSSTSLSQLTQLKHLELNLHRGTGINWRDVAQLPALQELILAPPVSPSSSGLGPEHAQQVVPTLLSFSIPVKDLLEGFVESAGGAGRLKRLLIQQTGSWDARSIELLPEFTGLEVLRMFPGPSSRENMWNNLAPVSGLSKLKELQLVGYSPVNFSNGSATGEALSAALPDLHTLELLVEPESDQVAAVAALTQLTRLKMMMQPGNLGMHDAEAEAEDAAAGDADAALHPDVLHDLQAAFQQVHGALAGFQQMHAQQHMEAQQLQHAQQQQQQQQQQAVAVAEQQAPQQQIAAAEQLVQQMLANLHAPQQAAAAAAPAAPAAAAAAPAPSSSSGGNPSPSSTSQQAGQQAQQQRQRQAPAGLGRTGGLGKRNAAAATRRSQATTSAAGSSSSAAATAAAAPARSVTSRFCRSRSSSGRAGSSTAGSAFAAAGAGAGPSTAEEMRVSSFALPDLPDLLFSSDEERDEAAALASAAPVAAATGSSSDSGIMGQVCADELTPAEDSSSSSSSNGGSGSNTGEAALPATGQVSIDDAGSSSSSSSSSRAGRESAEAGAGEDYNDDYSSTYSDTAPPGLLDAVEEEDMPDLVTVASSSIGDDELDALADSALAEDAAVRRARRRIRQGTGHVSCSSSGSSSSDSEGANDRAELPPGLPAQGSRHSAGAAGAAAAAGNAAAGAAAAAAAAGNSAAGAAAAAAAAAAAGNAAAGAAAAAGNAAAGAAAAGAAAAAAPPPMLWDFVGQQAAAGGAAAGAANPPALAGAAAAGAGNQQQQEQAPMIGPWGLHVGAVPAELSCLHPLTELRQLQHFELLSPLVPLTDSGLKPIIVGLKERWQQQQQAEAANSGSTAEAGSSAAAAAGLKQQQITAALPNLKSLTLSGAVHITKRTYSAIRRALPELQELNLVHARPGAAPFDVWDAAGGDQPFGDGGLGMGVMGPMNIGGLGQMMGGLGLGGAAVGGVAGVGAGGQGNVHMIGPFNMNVNIAAQVGGDAAAGGAAEDAAGAGAAGVGGLQAALQAALNNAFGQGQQQQQGGQPGQQQQQGGQPGQQQGNVFHFPVQVVMQVNDQPPVVLAGGGPQQQQQAGDAAAGAAQVGQQQQQQQGGQAAAGALAPPNLGAIMQQLMQQLAGAHPAAAAAAAGGAAGGANAPGHQPAAGGAAGVANAPGHQQPGAGAAGAAAGGLPGFPAGANIGLNLLDIQVQHVPAGGAAGGAGGAAAAGGGAGGGAGGMPQLLQGLFGNMFGGPAGPGQQQQQGQAGAAGNAAAGAAAGNAAGGAAGAAANGPLGAGAGLGGLGGLAALFGGPAAAGGPAGGAGAGAPGGGPANIFGGGGNAAAAAANGPPGGGGVAAAGPGAALGAGAGLGGLFAGGLHLGGGGLGGLPGGLGGGLGGGLHLHDAAAGGPAGGGVDPGDVIAPSKIAAADLPPGLKQLQLVNVGLRSSKAPLPCPRLVHLQMERCRAARAFRMPELSRCIRLTTLQLVNVHLEETTLQHIAASCPLLQRLCLTDYNAYASSAPVRSVSRVMPLVINQQQQAGGAAAAANAAGNHQPAAAAGAPAAAMGQPFGIVSEVVTTITSREQQSRPEVDWVPLASLRCLMQLSLKSSASHVVAAAQQLGQQQHTVKNLKLEAQGLKVAELQQVGQQLVGLPYLTWLALLMQYRPERRSVRPSQQRQAAAATGGSSTAASAASGGAVEGGAAAAAQPAAAGAAGPANGGGLSALGGGGGQGGGVGWAWEPAEQLGRQLMQQLPGTALELKVRPHGWY